MYVRSGVKERQLNTCEGRPANSTRRGCGMSRVEYCTSEGEAVSPWRAIELSQIEHENRYTSGLPNAWAEQDRANVERLKEVFSMRAANEWVRERGKEVAENSRGLLVASEDDLSDLAGSLARMCGNRFAKYGEHNFKSALSIAEAQAVEWGIEKSTKRIEPEDRAARLSSEVWWLGGLRKSQKRQLEQEARRRGYVHRKAGLYVSDEALKLRRAARERCRLALAGMELIGMETGTVLNMAEVAEASLANPNNRRAELMTRIRGFEDIAKQRGDVCEFVTVTAPSAYHARSKTGTKNSKWNGSSPRHVQAYLCKVWSRIRSKFKRDGLIVYGMRIAEPHHDGTPHWHLVLFVAADAVAKLRETMGYYALEENGTEKGAAEQRIKFVAIDPAKGSAAGYVIKYVCKNLTGVEGEQDYEGGGASADTAERVEAWASTWGIRQFQQIGGHRVGVWRELRRVPELDGAEPDCIKEAWGAANPQAETDRADWAAFINALGGIDRAARDALVTLVIEVEERQGRYGFEEFKRPLGIQGEGVMRMSARERWEVRSLH